MEVGGASMTYWHVTWHLKQHTGNKKTKQNTKIDIPKAGQANSSGIFAPHEQFQPLSSSVSVAATPVSTTQLNELPQRKNRGEVSLIKTHPVSSHDPNNSYPNCSIYIFIGTAKGTLVIAAELHSIYFMLLR